MLVLHRKVREKIFIFTPDGAEIEICLLSVYPGGNGGKIGINAPSDYRILREELLTDQSNEGCSNE